jgi:hypothetical protein
VSGKLCKTLVSAALVGLLPCSARADSGMVAPAVTGVIVSFGTPPFVPQVSEPASDPPAADPTLPSSAPSVAQRTSALQLTCDLCETSRPAYRVESHPRRGLVMAGAIIGGIGFGFAIAVAVGSAEGASDWNGVPFDQGALAAPILGPWITLGTLKQNCGGRYLDEPAGCTHVHTQDAWAAILIVDGVVQLLGTTLIIVGMALPRQELVITDTVKARVVPVRMGSTGHGLALVGSL